MSSPSSFFLVSPSRVVSSPQQQVRLQQCDSGAPTRNVPGGAGAMGSPASWRYPA